MFKVTFQWYQTSPHGGKGSWKEKFVLYDECAAGELNAKIDEYIRESSGSYQENMTAIDVVRI